MTKCYPLLAALIAILLTACGGSNKGDAADSPTPPAGNDAPGMPEGLFLDTPPADAAPLREARAEAKAGESIAFSGYIGGRVEPFTEGRALFLVADSENAPACTDECETPWDACCTALDTIAANSATVQLVDDAGKLLALNLEGMNGLKPGAAITVVGEVREANDAVLVVDATGLAIAD